MPQNKAPYYCHLRGDATHHLNNGDPESGNVFLIILLGVVLFGALSFSVARGFRSDNTSAMSSRQIELAASDILNYANQVERAVNRLRRNGCSENELSFWHDSNGDGTENASDTYYNTNAPTDNSCHIFQTEGGKVTYQNIGGNNVGFIGSNNFTGIGTTKGDLAMSVSGNNGTLKTDTCTLINKKVGAFENGCPAGGGFINSPFTGTFSDTGTSLGNPQNSGLSDLCIATNNADPCLGTNRYYKILIIR